MAAEITEKLTDLTEDLGYKAARTGALVVGKTTAPLLGGVVDIGMAAVLSLATGAAIGTIGAGAFSIGIVAVLTALSAAFGQSDHLHRRKLLLEEYREEIAAAVHIEPGKVTERDMDRLAEGDLKTGIIANPALKQSLDKSRQERNLSVVASSIASIGGFYFTHHVMEMGNVLEDAGSATGLLAKAGAVATHIGAGLGAYFAIQTPLHIIGDRIFGLDKESVQERIADIRRTHAHGKAVSLEQVLQVHLAARPELADQIEAGYGSAFQRLGNPYKHQVIGLLNEELKLNDSATRINQGQMKPEELAFSAFGQESGVKLKTPKILHAEPNLMGRMWEGLKSLKSIAKKEPEVVAQPVAIAGLPGETKITVAAAGPDNAVARVDNHFEAPGVQKNFVAMVGRSATANGATHVERITRQSSIQLS